MVFADKLISCSLKTTVIQHQTQRVTSVVTSSTRNPYLVSTLIYNCFGNTETIILTYVTSSQRALLGLLTFQIHS